MPRKLVLTAVLIALSCGFARAQVTDITTGLPSGSGNYLSWPAYETSQSWEERRRNQEIERQYRETVRTKIPDRKGSNDPWKTVRGAPTAVPVNRHGPE